MGSSNEAYTFIAVEYTLSEFKASLQANRGSQKLKSLLAGGYNYDIVIEYTSTYNAKKNKPGFFSHIDHEEETFGLIYFGYLIDNVYNATLEGSESESTSFGAVQKKVNKLSKLCPGKSPKIVTVCQYT